MTTTSSDRVVLMTPPPKVLQPRDPNESTPSALITPLQKTKTSTPGTTTSGRKARTPGRGLFSPTLPRQSRKYGKEERAEKFHSVCELKVGEDLHGDLDDLGLETWSVDDFTYVKKLGSGGVAQVYLALEKESGHPVALKVQQANDMAFCEIDLHMELVGHHPNILHMTDYFYTTEKFGPAEDIIPNSEEDKEPHYLYSILEVCEGGDLYQAIDAHYCSVPEPLAARYLRDAISALEQLHSHDMIHCDIKPANFLIDNSGKDGVVLKLADFGMAVRLEEKEVLGGSPVYMAPEHLLAWKHSGEPHAHEQYDFDQRSDIYSLGVVLYEVLMGYLPYEVRRADDDDGDLAEAVDALELGDDESDCAHPVLDLRKLDQYSEEPFVLPPPIFDGVSDEAQDLILRLLEADLDKRITLEEAKEHAFFKKHHI